MNNVSKCCKAPIEFKQIAGCRVYVERKGKLVYPARCSKCQRDIYVPR